MSAGCNHDAYPSADSFQFAKHAPGVCLSNDDDGHYVQLFENRSELEAFIAQLRAVADQVWGKAP